MIIVVAFLLVIAAIALWWLARNRLTEKPWLEEGVAVGHPSNPRGETPASKVGLGVFLVVVAALFSLFISAYSMRMGLADWQSMPLPRLLWFNTGMLALSSVALHCALVASRRGQSDNVRLGMVTAGLTALTFLAGQILAWRDMSASGYFLAANPANSFFYLITGTHWLHIVGGMVALGRTTMKAWAGVPAHRLRPGIELCAAYWHFMLLVWFAIFVLLSGWADEIIEICRQLIT